MTKAQLSIALILLLTAFAVGRYSVNVNKTTTTEQDNTKTHTSTTTTTIKEPTGEVKTVTTTDTTEVATVDKRENTILVASKRDVLNISLLAGTTNALIPQYGISVTKEVFGPVSVGAFGLSSGVVGLSIGLNF